MKTKTQFTTRMAQTGIYKRRVTIFGAQDRRRLKVLDQFVLVRQDVLTELHKIEKKVSEFLCDFCRSHFGLRFRGERRLDPLRFIVPSVFKHTAKRREELLSAPALNRYRRADLIEVEKARDACEVLMYIDIIRGGKNHDNCGCLFPLGRAYERFKVRDSELNTKTGDDVVSGGRSGGLKKSATAKDYGSMVESFASRNKIQRLSQKAFLRTLDPKDRVSRSTFQRALKRAKAASEDA